MFREAPNLSKRTSVDGTGAFITTSRSDRYIRSIESTAELKTLRWIPRHALAAFDLGSTRPVREEVLSFVTRPARV